MTAMKGDRTPAWWVTRIEFAIAIGTILPLGFWVFVPGGLNVGNDPMFGSPMNESIRLGSPLLRSWPSVPIAALLGAMVGLAWMIRIYRSTLEPEPPPWRYRDR
jgi:hypothetical protein